MKKTLRSLSRAPALFATAALLLAVGIGATTALFSVVNAVLLAPLPYKQPERLVRLWCELTARGVPHFPESPSNLDDLRTRSTAFEDIGGVTTGGATLVHAGGEPRPVQTANSTWNFPGILGVEPMMGRLFTAADGAFSATDVPPGAEFPANTFANPRVALIGHGLWQTQFGGRPDVVGQQFQLDGVTLEIVGVMPADLRLLMGPAAGVAPDIDVWTPLRVDLAAAPRNNVFLNMVGRLKPGVGFDEGAAEIKAVADRLYGEYPVMRAAGARLHAMPYTEELVADVRTSLWALLGAAAFVLLIACANVANLLLVRAGSRAREFAVRTALGAGRTRLVAQMLAESGALAAAGAVGGLLLAWAGLALVLGNAPVNIARLDAVRIDLAVFAFAAGVALLVTMLAGLVPALQGSRFAVADALRERSNAGLAGGRRLRSILVIGEIALSFVLLIGAGLMVRSFVELQRTELGFDPSGLLTFQVNLPFQQYPQFEQRRDFAYAFEDRLRQLPGVIDVSAGGPLPLTGGQFHGRYASEPPQGENTAYRQANYRVVLPGYFDAMGTPLLAGRHHTRDDEINARRYVVVDDVLAQRSWPGQDAIGKQVWLRMNQPDPIAFEVIGVVRRQLQDNLHEAPRESVYVTAGGSGLFGVNAWVLRLGVPAESLLPAIRAELAALDPSLPMVQVQAMDEFVRAAMARTRFALQLIGAFGLAALLIAAVGLFAAIHHLVRLRRAEIGVRMSFGAQRSDVFSLFVRHGMALAAAGIVVGLVAALALSRAIGGLLVNVAPTDPMTYAAVAVFFAAIALAASALPALRATRVDPMTVLRDE